MLMITLLVVQGFVFLSLIQETNSNFDDLGTLLLGGVAAAVVVAVVFSFVRLRLREKNPPKSNFTTIGATNEKE
jgi:high-affinity Fe2+/Pb2+ permease